MSCSRPHKLPARLPRGRQRWRAGQWPLRAGALALAVLAGSGALRAGGGDAPSPPARVVSMNLCTDQLALLLAAPGQLISVSTLAQDPLTSAMPEAAQALPGNHGLAEEIFLMRPDLVLAGSYTRPATVGLLRRLGIKVVLIAPSESLEDVRQAMRETGAALGREAEAEAMVAEFDAALARIAAPPPGALPADLRTDGRPTGGGPTGDGPPDEARSTEARSTDARSNDAGPNDAGPNDAGPDDTRPDDAHSPDPRTGSASESDLRAGGSPERGAQDTGAPGAAPAPQGSALPYLPPRAALYYANGYTTGERSLAGEILAAAGLGNIAAELGLDWGGVLALELLLLQRPDVLVTGQRYPGQSRAEELLGHPALAALRRELPSATAADPDWLCGTPHLLRAITAMARLREELQ